MHPEQENTEQPENEYVLGPNDPEPVVIAPFHFIILNIATGGLYSSWWIYKCWEYFRAAKSEDIWPVPRTFFFPLFSFDFFTKIETYCKEYGHRVQYNSPLLTVLVFASNIIAYQRGPYLLAGTIIQVVTLLLAVRELNFYFTGNKNGYKDDKLNQRQILLLLGGAFFWTLIIVELVANHGSLPNT